MFAESTERQVCAIILAAGIGSRMKADTTKQKMYLGNLSILKRSVLAFERCSRIDSIVVVARADELEYVKGELSGISKLKAVVIGGNSRAESARFGFAHIPENTDFVAIHDGARPLITPEMISVVVDKAIEKGAATAAQSVTDTVKLVDGDGMIVETVPRDRLMRALTPQVFDVRIYRRALLNISSDTSLVTDDNMLAERIGAQVYCVELEGENIKITTKKDLRYAEFLLRERGI